MRTLMIIAALCLTGCEASTMESLGYTRLYVAVDKEFGCEYLIITQTGGITPRMDADGKHVCRTRNIKKGN